MTETEFSIDFRMQIAITLFICCRCSERHQWY